MRLWLVLLCWVGVALGAMAAEPLKNAFEDKDALKGWELKGKPAVDPAHNHAGKGQDAPGKPDEGLDAGVVKGALRLGAGDLAAWPLRKEDGSGKVTMWIYDDISIASDPKGYKLGPRWGLRQADGRVVVMGVIYARYLSGDSTYASADKKDEPSWYAHVQYSGTRRAAGWHQWTFDFDAKTGLTTSLDGKKTRYNWNTGVIEGFNAVVLIGDAGERDPQTLWVDDIEVTLGGPMEVKPVPPPPPPPVTPDADPKVEKPAQLVEAVRGKHPRLLFTADEFKLIKERAAGPHQNLVADLLKYLPSCVPPDHTNFQGDATDAQRQGHWRMPTVALHYLLTGDPKSLANARGFLEKLLAVPDWETGEEANCGMGAANLMLGFALAFDWTYNDLDEKFRETCRQRLLLQARRMLYAGHQQKQAGTHYWQQDPQNNHRQHRLAGLVLGTLAAASGDPSEDYLLTATRDELQYMHDWLSPDGSFHESSSYMAFGVQYLIYAFDAADRCYGTKFLQHPFVTRNVMYRLHLLTPGLKDIYRYGDAGGLGSYNNYLFKAAALGQMRDAQAALELCLARTPRVCEFAWSSVIWHDPTITGGDVNKLPRVVLYPDLGVASLRDGWEEANASLFFKCGPYGGYKLNEYRNTNQMHYINVAHNHPDANSFQLFARGTMLATDDTYPNVKLTAPQNTIMVNGKGQLGEGKGWTQPLGKSDMTKLARLVTWKAEGKCAAMEGEAGKSYEGLARYRRLMLWVEGDYVLLLDDIRAGADVGVTWILHGPDVVEETKGAVYTLKGATAACPLRLLADPDDLEPLPVEIVIGATQYESHGKTSPRGKQLQLTVRARQWQPAVLFNLWERAGLTGRTKHLPNGAVQLSVSGANGVDDTWEWRPATDEAKPATLTGTRAGKPLFAVGPADKAPLPE